MPQIVLTIPDLEKAEEFLAHFVPNLVFIENAEILEEEKSENGLLYEVKHSYTVEDIEAIIAQFPKDKKWTFSDYQKYLPENVLIPVEIINNQIYVMAAPNYNHQRISNRLSSRMTFYVEDNHLGEILVSLIDVKLNENNSVQPDILFIAVTRYEIISKNYIEGAPDMVVEIWSPGNSQKERENKHQLYESKGITEYWQIEPKQKEVWVETLEENGKYEIFSQAKETGTVQSKVLEGFEMDLQKLFQ